MHTLILWSPRCVSFSWQRALRIILSIISFSTKNECLLQIYCDFTHLQVGYLNLRRQAHGRLSQFQCTQTESARGRITGPKWLLNLSPFALLNISLSLIVSGLLFGEYSNILGFLTKAVLSLINSI